MLYYGVWNELNDSKVNELNSVMGGVEQFLSNTYTTEEMEARKKTVLEAIDKIFEYHSKEALPVYAEDEE